MAVSSQQTLGEVARRLDDVFRQFENLANSIPTIFVTKELFEAYQKLVEANDKALRFQIDSQNERILELEDDKKWLYRLIIGAVILAVVGIIVGANAITGTHASP